MPHKVDLSDTPYAGTLSRLDHTNRTARERRGKYRAGKRYKPSWRHNEELDILLLTPVQRRALRAARIADGTITRDVRQGAAQTYQARLERFGAIGNQTD